MNFFCLYHGNRRGRSYPKAEHTSLAPLLREYPNGYSLSDYTSKMRVAGLEQGVPRIKR